MPNGKAEINRFGPQKAFATRGYRVRRAEFIGILAKGKSHLNGPVREALPRLAPILKEYFSV